MNNDNFLTPRMNALWFTYVAIFLFALMPNFGIYLELWQILGFSAAWMILVNLWKAYPTFRGESKITTWMYRVALNTVISAFRKASNRVHRNKSDIELSDELVKPSSESISRDDIDVLYQAIDRLSDIEKAVIMLYMEEKTYDDIAEIMGMTRTNVGVKINRIKKKLQNIFKKLANGY
mgnify:CR=1 FL=1